MERGRRKTWTKGKRNEGRERVGREERKLKKFKKGSSFFKLLF